MSSNSSTEFHAYRRPGRKDLVTLNPYEGSVVSFLKVTALHFLQLVYSQRAQGNFHYDQDDEKTEIKIVDQHAFQLQADDHRPAIIGIRGPLSWANMGMNQGMQEMDMRKGTTQNTDLITGSIGLNCLSRVGLEAEQIASDVFNLFKFFRPTLAKHGFFTVKSMSIGSEQLIEAPGEPKLFSVSVLMQCQIQDGWRLEPKAAAELKRVVIEGLTEVNGEEETVFKNVMEGGS